MEALSRQIGGRTAPESAALPEGPLPSLEWVECSLSVDQMESKGPSTGSSKPQLTRKHTIHGKSMRTKGLLAKHICAYRCPFTASETDPLRGGSSKIKWPGWTLKVQQNQIKSHDLLIWKPLYSRVPWAKSEWVEEQSKPLVQQGTEYEPGAQETIQELPPRKEMMERKEALR